MELAICEYYDICRVSFQNLFAAVQNPAREFNEYISVAVVRDERGRFEVWAGNVGAHHAPKSRVSLDYRLRESSFYRERIIGLLKDLDDTLQKATSLLLGKRKPIEEWTTPSGSPTESETDDSTSESSEDDGMSLSKGSPLLELDPLRALLARQPKDNHVSSETPDAMDIRSTLPRTKPPESEMAQLCQGFKDLVGHLYKISMMIRRPIPHDRFVKSESINVSHYDYFDLAHIKNCFPSVSEILSLRLARAMKRRRRYLIYNEQHHRALARPRRTPTQEIISMEIPAGSQPDATANVQAPESISHSQPVFPPQTGASFSRFGTNTEATVFVPPEDHDGDKAQSDAGTMSTFASTLASEDKVYIPPRPRGLDGRELDQFECPYCYHIVEAKSSHKWKLHIFRDLSPYVCTFDQCASSDLIFEKRSEWFTHELLFHRKEWNCNTTGHPTYRDQDEFEEHLRQQHSNWFVESQLLPLMKMFGRPSQAPFSLCPFCTEYHQEFNPEDPSIPCLTDEEEPIIRKDRVLVLTGKIKRHVARHLERLALFPLPRPIEDVASDGEPVLSGHGDQASSESRSSISESVDSSSLRRISTNEDIDSGSEAAGDNSLPPELVPTAEEAELNLPCRIIKPYHKNPDFVGRKEVLKQMIGALGPGDGGRRTYRQLFTLCGSGGVGKTQTALNYVFEHMGDFQAVLWAHASNPTQLLESFTIFALELGLVSKDEGAAKEPNACKALLKHWFDTTEIPWLLVMDSADGDDGTDVMREFLPEGAYGSILITSRDSSYVSKYGGVVLGELGENEATSLLLKSTRSLSSDPTNSWENRNARDIDAAQTIVRRLGYLPIGIMQAAQIINKDRLTLPNFLAEYNERDLVEKAALLELESSSRENYPFNLSTVWTMSYKTLNRDQQDLLNLMAFFDPVGIPLQLLAEGAGKASRLGNTSLAFMDSDLKFRRCKSALVRSSLVMQNEYLEQLWMHRLVQQSCHLRMDPKMRQEAFDRALALLGAIWPMTEPDSKHHVELWPLQNIMFPHLQSLARFYDESQSSDFALRTDQYFLALLYDASFFCYERGVYSPVGYLTEIAEKYSERSTEDCNLRMADIYLAKGAVECESNLRQVFLLSAVKQNNCIQASITSGQIKSPDAREALAYGSMGNACMALDYFEEAETWYMRAFDVWDRLPRPSEDRQIYASNMASCYLLQGRLDEANEILTPLATNWDDVSSFKTAIALLTLGDVQRLQGKPNEGFQTHLQAYKLFKATIGDRHHRTADSCYKIGCDFHRLRKYGNAIAMLHQALDIYNNDVRYQNEIARTTYKLGCAKVDDGDKEDGIALIEGAESIYRLIVPGSPISNLGQDDFDKLVLPWSR